MNIKIATWNVNSVRSRITHLTGWLREYSPDIVLLQELKTTNDTFPAMEIEELGYNIAMNGQKSYNGVAILSKLPLDDVIMKLPGDEADLEARYIEAVASGKGFALRVASVYVPNGQSPDSDKFQYKQRFLARLREHAKSLLRLEEILVIGGDYNVAPDPIDVYDPKSLDGTVCYHPLERQALRSIMHLGFYDAFRVANPDRQTFSWWDYRGNGFDAGKGMRIDHLLLSPQAADRLQSSEVVMSVRVLEKPSDHAPVVCVLDIGE
ncbi:MAG TPA: exodeoxyribonuclease III [Rickettsiales bacterium]|nr:exodeoxyribonuclease III [Rickettsiales bacterium]